MKLPARARLRPRLHGASLIELLIVIAIIALVASLIFVGGSRLYHAVMDLKNPHH